MKKRAIIFLGTFILVPARPTGEHDTAPVGRLLSDVSQIDAGLAGAEARNSLKRLASPTGFEPVLPP